MNKTMALYENIKKRESVHGTRLQKAQIPTEILTRLME